MAAQVMKVKPIDFQSARFHELAALGRQCCAIALFCHNQMARVAQQFDLQQVRKRDHQGLTFSPM
jgi:polysaccharide pyruvyl transferase WcaK-like protein